MPLLILSHYQTQPLLQARHQGQSSANTSPDLGMSTVQVALQAEGARFPGGEVLDWGTLEEISETENNCFYYQDGEMLKARRFSEFTNRAYSLYPTAKAPTMLISGIPMHRIKDTNPYEDTLEKIKLLRPSGYTLDTATGLGYTAARAAESAERVMTIELDPAVLEICRLNPWSSALFDNPKITQQIGDSFDVIEALEDGLFKCILHDPPAFSLAGHLYSKDFYVQLYRVLQANGRLFHYIGNPQSKSGANVTKGVLRRLGEAGFTRIERRPRAFGVVAHK